MTQLSIDLYSMKRAEEEVLREQRTFLLKNIVADVMFTGACTANKLFSLHFAEDSLQEYRANMDKVAKILDYIPRRGPKAFSRFIAVLQETSQNHVADRLIAKLEEKQSKQEEIAVSPAMSSLEEFREQTELPSVMKRKILDMHDMIRHALIESPTEMCPIDLEEIEEHSLNSIKLDHLEYDVQVLLRCFSLLCDAYRQCEESLRGVGVTEEVKEGVVRMTESWCAMKKEKAQMKEQMDVGTSEKNKLYRDKSVLEYEITLLKERDAKQLLKLTELQSELQQAHQRIEEMQKLKNDMEIELTKQQTELQTMTRPNIECLRESRETYKKEEQDTDEFTKGSQWKIKPSREIRNSLSNHGMPLQTQDKKVEYLSNYKDSKKTRHRESKNVGDFIKIFGNSCSKEAISRPLKDYSSRYLHDKRRGVSKEQDSLKQRVGGDLMEERKAGRSIFRQLNHNINDKLKSSQHRAQPESFLTKGSPLNLKYLRH